MKGLYSRLFIAFATIFFVLLTGLGVVLGQFFYLIDHEITLQCPAEILDFSICHLTICVLYCASYSAHESSRNTRNQPI